VGGNVLHYLAHAGFILSKIFYSTKPTVILHFSTTAAFWLWPTVLDTSSICLSEAAIYQKNPETVSIYVRTLGYTSYSENGQNEWKQKSLCTKAHWDTQLAYTMVLSKVQS
jgi:hypothetical protein